MRNWHEIDILVKHFASRFSCLRPCGELSLQREHVQPESSLRNERSAWQADSSQALLHKLPRCYDVAAIGVHHYSAFWCRNRDVYVALNLKAVYKTTETRFPRKASARYQPLLNIFTSDVAFFFWRQFQPAVYFCLIVGG